jgi:uncharacterized lipoprotein
MKFQHSKVVLQVNNNKTSSQPALEHTVGRGAQLSLRNVGVITVLGSSLLVGCSTLSDNALYGKDGLIRDRSKEYQNVQASSRLVVPDQLNAKYTRDAMEVPRIAPSTSTPISTVDRPEYFYADSGSESVNFKQDKKGKVLIIDEPINKVWPKAQQFMEFNNLGITDINPKDGSIVSDWIIVKAGEIGVVDSWLKKLTFQDIQGDNKNKIRIKLTTDEKSPWRTIVSMSHVRFPVNEEVSDIDWLKEAKNVSYKSDMLYELLRFMSKATSGAQNNGLLASKFKRSQRDGTVLFGRNANGKPALKISGNIDNAWNIVNNSLISNQIDVGTRDRKNNTFYLTFTSLTPRESQESKGFFEWLHSDRGPINITSFGFGDDEDKITKVDGKNVSYSAKGQVGSSKEINLSDPNHPANKEGYKIWLAGKVIYNFNGGFNKAFFNSDTNLYELTAGYQLKLIYRGNATFLTVLDKRGEEAATVPAEELLWRIKDSIPRS